jgi:hypothetical protein
MAIEKQLTQKEKDEIERNKKIALAKLAELRRQYKGEA